ncbi:MULTISPECIES: DUF6861 domain-containing protein [Pseudomonas]|uniref:NAD(+)--protein-arginine ADP-ribosyltransferase Tre1-like N-terminal domain-containing protein n=1 Tax=Pseudomonas juntendi TaxID=2666183 RepID=A0AAJ5UYP4_9PSED|nr:MULTISPECIES: hypothetical protein [Pseudomonas]MDH1551417.1 hypothetical protein [Pseudomonas juntendi]QOH72600.1 hypothetical protein IGB31_09530 [Pseudomonas putida]WEA20868.1 hypothetical protein PWA60_01295 [Pseudomonas juntendi]
MDFLNRIPTWDEIERNLETKFGELNQGIQTSWHDTTHSWDGFTRRLNHQFDRAYGSIGGDRIDAVREALYRAEPIFLERVRQHWSAININQIIDILRTLAKEVSMILGGSIAIGSIVGGAAGSLAFGAGAAPGAIAGGAIGLEVGNLVLVGLGLSAITEYFLLGAPQCLATLQDGIITAWQSEDGLPSGLDPTGGSAARREEMISRAANQLARGQEQLIQLLLSAIVAYLLRGPINSGISNSMESIASRSLNFQAELTNSALASWLGKNQIAILSHPELQPPSGQALTKIRTSTEFEAPKWENVRFRADGDFGNLPALRQLYVREVFDLQQRVAAMRGSTESLEAIAKFAYSSRTKIKLKYREFTPPDLLKTIDERNIGKYGDKLGPTFEWLVEKGKSFEQIIESATRSGGGDLF